MLLPETKSSLQETGFGCKIFFKNKNQKNNLTQVVYFTGGTLSQMPKC
jgi:hypothetical protein